MVFASAKTILSSGWFGKPWGRLSGARSALQRCRQQLSLCDDETRVVFGLFVAGPENFAFDDDAAPQWHLPAL